MVNPIYSLEAEQYILGCIIQKGDIIQETMLSPEHFYTMKHRDIFDAMKKIDLKQEKLDMATLSLELMGNNQFDPSYITDLKQSVPSVEPWRTYEKHILDTWKMRKAQQITLEMNQHFELSKDLSALNQASSELRKLEEMGIKRNWSLKELLIRIYEKAEIDRGEMTGIDTGYVDLNRMTSGLQNQDLIILAARPSVGKTAFALNIGRNFCESGGVLDIFSLEMPDESLMNRVISAVGNIESSKLKNPKGTFQEEDWQKLSLSIGKISEYKMEIHDEPNVTVQDIRSAMIPKRKNFPNHQMLVIIDYLQLMKGSGGGNNRVQELGEITRELKILARDLDCPIIALSQLSRSVEQRQDKRPMLSDIRESGAIEQDADIVGFLYREDYYNKEAEEKNITEIIIGKHRNGPTGTVKLVFLKEYNKFLNLEYHESFI